MEHPNTPSSPIAELVARARAAQRIYETWSQAQVDTAVVAAGWAIIEPAHNRELAELAVKDTGVGNVEDKVRKNHRKTFGLLRDLHGARSVGVITEDPARGIVEIARPVGVVCAITPSTNPGATPANKIINALKGRNAVIVAPSPMISTSCSASCFKMANSNSCFRMVEAFSTSTSSATARSSVGVFFLRSWSFISDMDKASLGWKWN